MFSDSNSAQRAECLLRISFGFFMLFAGLGKFMGAGVDGFVTEMGAGFEGTFLPMALVTAFLYLVPVLEIILGVWLLINWNRNMALWGTGILLFIFLFGQLVQSGIMGVQPLFIYIFIIAYTTTLPTCKKGCLAKLFNMK